MANGRPGHERGVLVEHRGKRPTVDPTAYVAPTAVLSGDVHVGPDARVLYGAVLTAEDGRVNGVVHVKTSLEDGALVPIGWVAVGDPAEILPPDAHDRIWGIQERLDFPGTVYGVARDTPARERMERQVAWFAAHRDDRGIES